MSKAKKEKKYDKNLIMDVFVHLYKQMVDKSSKPTKEQKDQAHKELRSKHITHMSYGAQSTQTGPIVNRPISCLHLSVIPRMKRSRKLSNVPSILIPNTLSQNPSTIHET